MCVLGERVSGTCSHVATVVFAGCGIAHNPAMFKPTTSDCFLLDRQQANISHEIMSETVG